MSDGGSADSGRERQYTFGALALWEIIVMLVLLKIPIAYIGWVIWWAVKAEPELGAEGGTDGVNWTPWRRPPTRSSPSRPHRGSGERSRERAGQRAGRPQRQPAIARAESPVPTAPEGAAK
jgi:hypothetical protein